MATILSIGKNGRARAGNGRFRPGHAGGPGRPRGSPNHGTVDARTIKSELLASWRKYGPAALETVARERPLEYIKLVVALLPDDSETGPTRLDAIALPPPAGREGEVVPDLLDDEP